MTAEALRFFQNGPLLASACISYVKQDQQLTRANGTSGPDRCRLTFRKLVLARDVTPGRGPRGFGKHHAAHVGLIDSDRLHGAVFPSGVKHHVTVDLRAAKKGGDGSFCLQSQGWRWRRGQLTSANTKAASKG